ncbi:MAG: hypothetical protein M3Q69_11130 [Acidobacteriota bacterium]|nr:hypothetical protein [Acidobacteriota bacterium]
MPQEDDDPVNEASNVSNDDVFEYGDRTIFQLRAQPIDFDEQYGTMMAQPAPAPLLEPPADLPTDAPPMSEVAATEVVASGDDRVAMLERKLEAALRRIDLLQQRLDSIDATVARALNR